MDYFWQLTTVHFVAFETALTVREEIVFNGSEGSALTYIAHVVVG
jgi:hypothetical protein